MNSGRTVFAQLVAHLSHIEFQKCVARYDGDQHHRSLSCWDQYLAMAFAQFTYRESLRDIEACLGSMGGKLYHMGFRSRDCALDIGGRERNSRLAHLCRFRAAPHRVSEVCVDL